MLKNPRLKKVKPKKGKLLKEPSTTGSFDWFYSNKLYPAFSFKHSQKNYSVLDIDKDDSTALIKRLNKLSQMQWCDIQSADRHGLGQEKIKKESFNVPIPNIVTPDVNLLALRYNGKKPFVGYRYGKIFYILWIDYNFSVYDHGS